MPLLYRLQSINIDETLISKHICANYSLTTAFPGAMQKERKIEERDGKKPRRNSVLLRKTNQQHVRLGANMFHQTTTIRPHPSEPSACSK